MYFQYNILLHKMALACRNFAESRVRVKHGSHAICSGC